MLADEFDDQRPGRSSSAAKSGMPSLSRHTRNLARMSTVRNCGAASTTCAPGDTPVVPSMDRLGRSLQDLISIVAGLRKRGTGFRSRHEALDTTTPGECRVFHVYAALAEFIRELIVDGTNEGLAAARACRQRLGRPPAMSPEQTTHARAMLTRPDATVSSIARVLGALHDLRIRARARHWTGEPRSRTHRASRRRARRVAAPVAWRRRRCHSMIGHTWGRRRHRTRGPR
ncbi:recombinase family protein [Nocardia pseudovaccinii]|uniref:recombinase family protein n=1 Tax=Nocardia pseudovaccinii TaxID=189540 RepID=UPI003D93DCFB